MLEVFKTTSKCRQCQPYSDNFGYIQQCCDKKWPANCRQIRGRATFAAHCRCHAVRLQCRLTGWESEGNWSPGERCDIFTITGNLEYFISGSASHPSEPLTLSPPLSLSHVETTWNNTFLTRLHGHLVEWVYRFFWVPRKRTLVHGAVNLWISKQCS